MLKSRKSAPVGEKDRKNAKAMAENRTNTREKAGNTNIVRTVTESRLDDGIRGRSSIQHGARRATINFPLTLLLRPK